LSEQISRADLEKPGHGHEWHRSFAFNTAILALTINHDDQSMSAPAS